MEMDQELVILVEKAAETRGEISIPREHIIKALEKIEDGGEQVERYPSGSPSLKGVFNIATKLHAETMSQH